MVPQKWFTFQNLQNYTRKTVRKKPEVQLKQIKDFCFILLSPNPKSWKLRLRNKKSSNRGLNIPNELTACALGARAGHDPSNSGFRMKI